MEYKVGQIVKFWWNCTGGRIVRTGRITELNYGGKDAVQIYTKTPSSEGWSRVLIKDIIG